MIRLVTFFFFVVLFFGSASADTSFRCQDADVKLQSKPSESPEIDSKFLAPVISVSVSERRRSTSLLFLTADFIGIECRKNKKGQTFIIFQAYCSGTASECTDGANYGIIDPETLQVLLVPHPSNYDLAKRIFGQEVKPPEKMYSRMSDFKK